MKKHYASSDRDFTIPAPTRSFKEALHNWNSASEDVKIVPQMFWETMMAANNSEVFADQRSLYGTAHEGMKIGLAVITGLRGQHLEKIIDGIHDSGEFEIPYLLKGYAERRW